MEPHAVVFPAFPSGTTTIAYQQPAVDVGGGVNPGSSHTAFTVQSPFQPPNNGSHLPHPHPMTNGSPHSPSPSSAYSPSGASMNVQSPQSARSSNLSSPLSLPDATTLLSSIPTRTNPLPEPPKESPYRPKTRTSHDTSNGLDLWTNYTGLTTAH